MRTAKEMIAAVRKVVAAITRILFWPLTILATKITNANLQMVRWAVRHNSGAAYLFAIFWAPALMLTGFIWLAASAPQKPGASALTVGLVVVNKGLMVALFVLQQAYSSRKAVRFYRRHFWPRARA